MVAIETDCIVDFEVFLQDLMQAFEEKRNDRELNFTYILNYSLEKLLSQIRVDELIENQTIYYLFNVFEHILFINCSKLSISIFLFLCIK